MFSDRSAIPFVAPTVPGMCVGNGSQLGSQDGRRYAGFEGACPLTVPPVSLLCAEARSPYNRPRNKFRPTSGIRSHPDKAWSGSVAATWRSIGARTTGAIRPSAIDCWQVLIEPTCRDRSNACCPRICMQEVKVFGRCASTGPGFASLQGDGSH